MDPGNFLSKLQLFPGGAIADEIEDFYVPSLPTSREDTQWYGITRGVLQYGHRNQQVRDWRICMYLVVTDKPFLWGRSFSRGYPTERLLPTAEENSQMFFGCRGWSEFLTDQWIQSYLPFAGAIRENVEALRKAGMTRKEFAHHVHTSMQRPYPDVFDPLMRGPRLVVDAYKHGLLGHPDLKDIIRWLENLWLTVSEAKKLWKASSAGRTITVSYIRRVNLMDYRSKKPKDNLHDFLAAVIASCERKTEAKELKEKFPDLPSPLPEGGGGVVHIKTAAELVKLSKRYGWCAGQKHYREGAARGDWYFLFHPTHRVLMQFSRTGNMMQARGPSNCLVEDTAATADMANLTYWFFKTNPNHQGWDWRDNPSR